MKIKLPAFITLIIFVAGLIFSGCSKKDSDFDKTFLNNKERKESYVIGSDFASLIKSVGGANEQFSRDIFFKGFRERFNDMELPIGIDKINKIMEAATDSIVINLDTVRVGNYNFSREKQSYIFGAYHADKIRQNFEIFNLQAFEKGFNDEFDGNPKLLTNEEINVIKEISRRWIEKIQSSGDPALATEEKVKIYKEFLEENSTREAVTTLPSGLQYAVIKEGKGGKLTNDTTMVKVDYRAFFIDGREFDSSFKKNQSAEFSLAQVIPGWREGIKLMSVGSKYKFFVPAELAYGKEGMQNVPPNTPLIYEVELLEIK